MGHGAEVSRHHRIAGRIVGDDQAFDDEGIGGGWAWDYLQYGYAAPVGALQYNEDVATLTVTPGTAAGDPAVVQLAAGAGLDGAQSRRDRSRRRTRDHRIPQASGSSGAGSVRVGPADPPAPDAAISLPRTVGRQVAVVNPTVFFAQSLKDALVARGIAVDGSAVDLDEVEPEPIGPGAAERRMLARTESPPLREIAPVLMKVSQNLYAETLLKAAGAAGGGIGTVQAGRTRGAERRCASGK